MVNGERRAFSALVHDYVYLLRYPLDHVGSGHKATIHRLNQINRHLIIEVQKMAAKKGAVGSKSSVPDDLKWINRNLTDEEKQDHDVQGKTPEQLGLLLWRVALQGYNVRVAFDAYSKCFQANLVPYQAENPNFGYAISARGATPERAFSLLLYKHYAIFKERWTDFYKATSVSMEG